jgi:cytidyltransferase-like protein
MPRRHIRTQGANFLLICREMAGELMPIEIEEELAARALLRSADDGLIWVYAPGICDLFHVGHVEFFRRARAFGDRVVVGIPTDENTASYKPRPIMNLEERVAVVAACRYVDRVIPDPPMVVDAAFLDSIGAAFVCHGDDISEAERERFFPGLFATGRFKIIPYTRTVSSREIIERVAQRLREGTLRIHL